MISTIFMMIKSQKSTEVRMVRCLSAYLVALCRFPLVIISYFTSLYFTGLEVT